MTSKTTRRRGLAAILMALTAGSITVAQVVEPVATPPLVISPPAMPVKSQKVELPPVEVAPPPVVVVPPAMVAPAPAPVVATPAIEPPALPATPVVQAVPVSMAKPPRVGSSEIVSSGPKPVDSAKEFATALAAAKAAHAKLRDYSGHLLLQERVKGTLQAEHTAELRVRTTPRAVAVKFIAPGPVVGREVAFLEGRYANKARAKAPGTYGPLAYATVPLSDAKAMLTSKLTLADATLGAALDRIDRVLAMEAKLKNPVVVLASDVQFAGKAVKKYEICCDRAHALRDAARLVVCIDTETKLPVRLEAYDAPTAGKVEGELREAISYVNLSFNKGIGDAQFEK